jgi:hypothetical protein
MRRYAACAACGKTTRRRTMNATAATDAADPADPADPLERYNVTWDSPSRDASGSMPLGNGDLALNAWVEAGGDLLLLLAKGDAWDENSINLKLGRLRLSLTPKPFAAAGAPFRQTIDLRRGEIGIVAGAAGSTVTIRLWVDANQPVLHVEADGERPFEVRASVEIWRTRERTIKTVAQVPNVKLLTHLVISSMNG